jgi:hypothetical protein
MLFVSLEEVQPRDLEINQGHRCRPREEVEIPLKIGTSIEMTTGHRRMKPTRFRSLIRIEANRMYRREAT